MLTQPLLDKLSKLHSVRFPGCAGRAAAQPSIRLTYPSRSALACWSTLRPLAGLTTACAVVSRPLGFPIVATIEDLDLSARRGLNRGQVLQLAQSEWVDRSPQPDDSRSQLARGKLIWLVLLVGRLVRPGAKFATNALPVQTVQQCHWIEVGAEQ